MTDCKLASCRSPPPPSLPPVLGARRAEIRKKIVNGGTSEQMESSTSARASHTQSLGMIARSCTSRIRRSGGGGGREDEAVSPVQRPVCSCAHQERAAPLLLFLHSFYFSLWRRVGLVGWVGAQRRQSGRQSGSVNAVQSGVKHTRVCDAQEQERRRSRKEERASPSSVPPPPPLSPREDGCKKMDSPGG